ncbi:MAG: amidohydrolase family protein [Bacteroidetes bacterium]|nr:amidohydrolase family protein [Bacteroidota bacterium]
MYRKFKADNIFTGRHLLPAGQVLVTSAEGKIKEIIPDADAGDDVEIYQGILCPGFINCHCHIELSHLHGQIAEHTGLVSFVQQVMSKRHATPEHKQQSMLQAQNELWQSGTMAIADICNTADSVTLKQQSNLYWHNFMEVAGFDDAGALNRFTNATNLQNEFIHAGLLAYITPHAPYSVGKKLFDLINNATAKQLISIHNQETRDENNLYKNKTGDFLSLYKNAGIDISSFSPTGLTSLQSYAPYFTQQQGLLLVHNSFTNQSDISFLAHTSNLSNYHFCICINANLFIENTLPPIEILIDNNCHIVLGTDSLASNHCLNMFEEIKTIQKHYPGIALEKILQWATLNGAQTLGIQDKFGSFDTGLQPGILHINHQANAVTRII